MKHLRVALVLTLLALTQTQALFFKNAAKLLKLDDSKEIPVHSTSGEVVEKKELLFNLPKLLKDAKDKLLNDKFFDSNEKFDLFKPKLLKDLFNLDDKLAKKTELLVEKLEKKDDLKEKLLDLFTDKKELTDDCVPPSPPAKLPAKPVLVLPPTKSKCCGYEPPALPLPPPPTAARLPYMAPSPTKYCDDEEPAEPKYLPPPALPEPYNPPAQYYQPEPYNAPAPYYEPEPYNPPASYYEPEPYNPPASYYQPEPYNPPAPYYQPEPYNPPAPYYQPEPYYQPAPYPAPAPYHQPAVPKNYALYKYVDLSPAYYEPCDDDSLVT